MSSSSPYRFAASGGESSPPPRPLEREGGAEFPFGRHVLITEDNWLIASEWEAALVEAGYCVTGIAVSADEALASCDEDPPDFVLMDIRLLGERDGIDVAVELRERCDLGSIFVSAHDDPETRQRAAPARPLGWIAKPFVAVRIAELIRNLAQQRT